MLCGKLKNEKAGRSYGIPVGRQSTSQTRKKKKLGRHELSIPTEFLLHGFLYKSIMSITASIKSVDIDGS